MQRPKPLIQKIVLILAFTLAWLLHGLSEWAYSAASWLYCKCGTDIFAANIEWENNDE